MGTIPVPTEPYDIDTFPHPVTRAAPQFEVEFRAAEYNVTTLATVQADATGTADAVWSPGRPGFWVVIDRVTARLGTAAANPYLLLFEDIASDNGLLSAMGPVTNPLRYVDQSYGFPGMLIRGNAGVIMRMAGAAVGDQAVARIQFRVGWFYKCAVPTLRLDETAFTISNPDDVSDE